MTWQERVAYEGALQGICLDLIDPLLYFDIMGDLMADTWLMFNENARCMRQRP